MLQRGIHLCCVMDINFWVHACTGSWLECFIPERTQRGPALFAPVHDLSRQIQILNAYCREAEFLGDALHGTMWDLLDEMIEIHAKLAQKSLFAGMNLLTHVNFDQNPGTEIFDRKFSLYFL